jgi:DNA-binding beta-propeller fold protein YncE
MTTQMRTGGRLTGALLIIALTLLSAAVASAQTSTTTTATTTSETPTKQVAPTDTTAGTSVGLNDGVTSMAADSGGNLYASLQYTNKVVKLNGAGTVIATFVVGRNPTGLLVDNNGGFLYVLNNADNTVSKLKLDGTPAATFKVAGDGPVSAALYAGVLYVACERSNTLVRLSATDGTALGSSNVGARPVWVVVSVTSTKYYYSSYDMASTDSAMTTSTTDPATADCLDCSPAPPPDGESTTVDASSTTDGGGTAPPPDSTADTTSSGPMLTDSSSTSAQGSSYKTVTTVNVYVSCNKANEVWKLSSAGSLVAKFGTGRGPFGLAVNSRGELYVACFWDSVVQRFSSAGTVLSRTAVGDGAAGLISYGNVLAVVSNGANAITRLSLADGTFISKDVVDRSPLIGAATPSALWVACTGSGTIAKRAL